MLSLLVLLAPVGAAEPEECKGVEEWKRGKQPLFSVLNVRPVVRIVQGNWPEARLVPHVAGILIRQVLGYNVEYKPDGGDGANSSRMYEMLANEEADLALTLWPAKFWNTKRSTALSKACPKSSTNRCMATVGNQGYKGRSGWFVSTEAYELPVKNLCESGLSEERDGGSYDCFDGSWVFKDSKCCPRADQAKGYCGGRKPCVALMVDDPTFDAGLNEAIAARLARPTRVMGEDDRSVDIQIVYGDVPSAMSNFTQQDKPLLAYSWLPRAGVIDAKHTRISLESYYHCGDGDPSTPFLTPFEREVTACDFPIQPVEKAVVWNLQQPSSTTAALFVNKFKLNASQLIDLLKLINVTRSSTPSEVEQAACHWLSENRDTWEDWLPDNDLYDHVLYQWNKWLIACGLVSLVGGMIVYLYLEASRAKGEEAEAFGKNISYDDANENVIHIRTHSSWPADKKKTRYCLVSCLSCMWVAAFSRWLDAKKWNPVFEYLHNSLRCMVNAEKCKFWSWGEADDWSFFSRLVIYALGQLFVGASTGFFESLIYSSWLTYGLNHLSLEVTISCAVIMLTLELVKWGLHSLPSGEQVVRRQLQIRLRIKFFQLYLNKQVWDSAELDQKAKVYCVKRFENAIESSASELASNCYLAAWSVFSELLGFLSAIAFLCYYTFDEGIPDYVSYLLIVALFVFAPAWLCIVLAVGPVLRAKAKANVEGSDSTTFTKDGLIMWTLKYKTAYGGIKWICVYFLWAFGPILINPLKNNLGPGTNFVPLPDLLAVLKVLGTMGTSLIALEGALSKMAKTSSKAAEVSHLLSLKDFKDVNGLLSDMQAEAEKKDKAEKKIDENKWNKVMKNRKARIERLKKWGRYKDTANERTSSLTTTTFAAKAEKVREEAKAEVEAEEAKAKAEAEAADAKVCKLNIVIGTSNLEKAEEDARTAIEGLARIARRETSNALENAAEEAERQTDAETPATPSSRWKQLSNWWWGIKSA